MSDSDQTSVPGAEALSARDPHEGLADDGTIRTSADPAWTRGVHADLLEAATERISAAAPDASVYVYGSVATGRARVPTSDVDLLTIGFASEQAASLSRELSAEFAHLCRDVEIVAMAADDFVGDGDEAYGNRVFLHHYCVHLAGPDLDPERDPFPGDRRAARGFNGDIARHATRWHHDVDTVDPGELGRRIARKTLLAVAGLVSVHDATWTTDREFATLRWQHLHPELADGLAELVAWSTDETTATRDAIERQLDGPVARIVEQFAAEIGLWSGEE